jgi:23S rRNA pseudouridine1911/1915/1917 synthase
MHPMHRKLKWRLESTGTEIIYDDDQLMVLNKPANLLVLPDRFRLDIKNLCTILTEELGKVFLVHRIDKETSGIVVYAKTPEAHAAMVDQFEHRLVEKVYMGIVEGTPPSETGRIEAPIGEDPIEAGAMKMSHRSGTDAITEFRVLEHFNGYAFVELRPRTCRTPHIRVHLRSIGTPLLSDKTYGDGKPFFLSHIKPRYRTEGEEKPLLERTALHAFAISFDHPTHGDRTNLVAEMPKDMISVLRYLRKFRRMKG